MNTKTDPYATKLHKRIDALLLLFIVVVIALLVRPIAKGKPELPGAVSSVRQPFWSTLAVFTSKADVNSVAALGAQYQFDLSDESASNAVALAGASSEPETKFSPLIAVDDRKPHHAVALNLDQDQGARSFSAPSSLPIQTQISGVGSTVLGNAEAPAFRNGYSLAGTDARDSSSSLYSAIETSPRYAGEAGAAPFTASTSDGVLQNAQGIADTNTYSFSLHAESAPTYAASAPSSSNSFAAKSQSGSFIPKAITLGAPDQIAGNTWTGGSGTTSNWSDSANWGGSQPGYGTITFAGATRLTNTMDQSYSMNQLNVTSAGPWTLNVSNSAVLSLFDNGGTQAKVENNGSGLMTLNIPITFAATAGAAFGEINAVSGDMTFGTGTLTVNGSQVAGIKMFGGGHTTTFNNTVSASGKWFGMTATGDTMVVGGAFTSGDIYVMNGGTLKLNSGGTITSSAIRLGGDFGNTGNQNQTLGGTFQFTNLTGGQTQAGVFNTVTGNTSGALLIDSLNTSGTNTLSADTFLDSNLRVNQASGGTLVLSDTTFDLKAQTLTLTGSGGLINITGVIGNTIAGGQLVVGTNGTAASGGTVTLSAANTYTGDTFVRSGTLAFTSAGSSNSSSIRLGSTSGTSVDADLNLTTTTGGTTLSTTINPVSTSGSGTLTLNSQNTSGTNTLSGHFGEDRNLSITQTTGGTLAITQARTGGAGTTTGFDIKTTTVTLSGGGNINFSGDVYNSTGAGTGTIVSNSTGTITLGGAFDNVSLAATVNSGTLTLAKASTSGIHALGGTLTINGGTVNLGGTGGDQIFDTAGVTIAGGTFAISTFNETVGAVSLQSGSITGSSGVLTGSSYDLQSGSVGAILGGSAAATKSTTGTVTLSGANTYGGLTTVSAGTLILTGTNSSAGAATVNSAGTLQLGAGTNGGLASGLLTLTGTLRSTDASARTISNAVSFGGNATFGAASAGALTLNGTVTLGATRTLTITSDTTFASAVSGSTFGITKSGGGTLTFSGSASNTYSGTTTVNVGELDLNKTAGVSAIAGDLTIGDGTSTDTVRLLAANQISDTSVVTLTLAGAAVFNLNGNNETIGSLTDSAVGASGAAVQLGAGTLTFGDASNRAFGGVISGSGGSIVKQGSGTQTLNGTSTFTGGTTISGGTLALGNATDTLANAGAVNVGNGVGGTLDLLNHTDTIGALTLNKATVQSTGGAGTLTTSGVTVTGTPNTISSGATVVGNATFGSGAALADNGALTGNATVGNGTLSGSGSVSGTTSVTGGTVNGSGLTLTGLVTFNGGSNTLSGTETATGGVSLAAGASLNQSGTLIGNISLTSGATSLTGSGTVGAVTLNGGGNTITGNSTLTTSGLTINSTNNTLVSGTILGAITQNASSALTVNGTGGSDALANLATLSGTGTVGVVTLAGNNTLSSSATLATGGITVNGTGNSISGGTVSGAITQNASSALAVNGTGGNDAMASGATLSGIGTVGSVSLAGSNTISSTGTLTTSGLTVNGSGNSISTGTVTGGSTINSGAFLTVNGTGTSTLTSTGTFELKSGTVGAILAGSGIALNKTTAGTVTLNGLNTYTGLTNITAGTLAESVSNAIATGALTVNGSTAIFDLGSNHTDSVGIVTLDGGGSIIGSGTSTLTSTGTFEMKSGTVNAKLAGSGIALNKTTAGTVTLNSVNTFTGLTNITAGTLAEGVSNAISTGDLTVNGSTAIFDLGSNHTDSVGIVTLDGGGAINGSGTSALTSTGTFEMKSGTVSAILAGTGTALNKTTANTVTLSGNNTYTGTTTISAGTLALSGATTNNIASSTTIVDNATLDVTGLSGSAITLASGQTLKGSGTVLGGLNVNSGSFLSPGNSPGTLSSGNTAYNSGGTYIWQINNATGTQGADPGWDWNNITGTLTIGATNVSTFTIDITSLTLGNTAGAAANFNKYGAYDWTISTASGGFGGSFAANKFTLALGNFLNDYSGTASGGTFSIVQSGNDLIVHYNGATDAAPAAAYWTGNASTGGSVWNTSVAGDTNWATDTGGATDTHAIPGSTSNLFFTATSASNLSNTLGQDFTINSLNFTGTGTSATAGVTIGGNTLTINATNVNGNTAGSGITVASGSGADTINSAIALGAAQTWTNNSTNALTVNGIISGAFALTKAGTGEVDFGGANTYSGGTTVSAGTLKLTGGTLGSTSASLTVNSTLDLNGTGQTVGAFNGNSSGLIKSSTGSSSLTVGNGGGSGSFAGQISNIGTIALTKTGSGTETLTGNNSYTGGPALTGTSSVTVNTGGTLLLSGNNQLNQAVPPGITLAGGKLDAGGFTQGTAGNPLVPNTGLIGMGALTMTSSSIIDLTGTSVLHFTASNANTWTGTLSIYDWTGTPITGGGLEQILFGGDATGLSATQLTQVSFYSDAGSTLLSSYATILLDGEIVPGVMTPVPEPSTWVAGALALLAVGYMSRRRFQRKLIVAGRELRVRPGGSHALR